KDWYYRASVFAMPSVVSLVGDTDGLPTVVVEALASGLPVVGSDVAGIPEVVRDGVTGYLIPSNAPEPLAARIQGLLRRMDLREKFACEGRRLVERELNLDRNVSALCDLIARHVATGNDRSLSELHPAAQ